MFDYEDYRKKILKLINEVQNAGKLGFEEYNRYKKVVEALPSLTKTPEFPNNITPSIIPDLNEYINTFIAECEKENLNVYDLHIGHIKPPGGVYYHNASEGEKERELTEEIIKFLKGDSDDDNLDDTKSK